MTRALRDRLITVALVVGYALWIAVLVPFAGVLVMSLPIGASLVNEMASDGDVRLPDGLGVATAEVGFLGDYYVSVRSPRGHASALMWRNWGPAHRASFYLTPERTLVVLHPGGGNTFIALEPRPLEFRPRRLPGNDGEWRYLGAVDRDARRRSNLRFFAPDEQRECIPLLGAGSSSFRREHQLQHSCDHRQLAPR
jgi:hypothetical protein